MVANKRNYGENENIYKNSATMIPLTSQQKPFDDKVFQNITSF